MAVISGTVLLGPGETPGRATVLLLNEAADSVVASTESDPVTGAYSFDAPGNQTYRVVVMGDGAYRSRAYGPVVTADFDPHWANVVSLLHFDGADGSTSFIDETGKIWTPQSGAELDTQIVKYGSAVGLFSPPPRCITTPADPDFAVGTEDFTVEGWVFLVDSANNCPLASCSDASSGASPGWTMYARHAGAGKVMRFFNATSGGVSVVGTTVVTLNAWHHVAAARESGVLRLFLNGVLDGAAAVTSDFTDYAQMKIGAARGGSPGDFIRGRVDEFRLTKGVARYTANFTPPSAPFPNSGP